MNKSLGYRASHFILTGILLLLLVLVPFVFLLRSTRTVQSNRSVIIGFSQNNDGQLESFIAHEVDGDFDGFRVPFYPVAQVDIAREVLWLTLPNKAGQRNSFARLHSTDSIAVRIRDGEDEIAARKVWDFPPLDQREPQKIEPGSILDQSIDEMPLDIQDSLRSIFTGVPQAGEPIDSPRKEHLIQLTIDALVDGGHEPIGIRIRDRQASYSYVVWSGWALVAGAIGFVIALTLIFMKLDIRQSLRRWK